MENVITILPNAASLIESMRSIGYSFETAIADILDNSISAQASLIEIYQRQKNGIPYIQVLDNGTGMSSLELIEAMRLGSKNPLDVREKKDLGRFGLGLKSASFSQCRKLTVISYKDDQINGYQWNLDLVMETNLFNVKILTEEEISSVANIEQLKKLKHGTIVQWEDFDRINESTVDLVEELGELMNATIEHIALIFHRFLEDGLKINVNFEPIIPKDPFLINHKGTQELKDKKIYIEGEKIHLYPFVLPHFSKLSSEDKRKAGKANEQYKSQGFYLYRNKRLIIWGDYLGLARKSELGKNVRIKVDIPNSLDYLWEIDVKKSRANVPSKIKKNLLSAISDGENVSRNVNTYKGNKEITRDKPIWQYYSDREDSFHFEINQENDLYHQFVDILDEDQKKIFSILCKTLEASIPFQAIYSQIGSGKKINTDIYEEDSVTKSLNETIQILKNNSHFDVKLWLQSIVSVEPYASSKSAKELINKEIDN